MIVLEGIEQWVKELLSWVGSLEKFRTRVAVVIGKMADVGKQPTDRKLILIGSDITKGIVPLRRVSESGGI